MEIQIPDMQDHMISHPENSANVVGLRIVHYDQVLEEYYIPIRRGGRQLFSFCPFCGGQFPESQRERWFTEVEKLGLSSLDPSFRRKLPEAYKSVKWRT